MCRSLKPRKTISPVSHECRTFSPRTFFPPVITPPFTVRGGGAHQRSFITSTIVALVVIIEQRCRLRLLFDSSNRSAQADRSPFMRYDRRVGVPA